MGFTEKLKRVGARLILAMSEVEIIETAQVTVIEQRRTERGTTYFIVTLFDQFTGQNYQFAIAKEARQRLDISKSYKLAVLRGDSVAHLLVYESTVTGSPSDIMAEGRYIFFQEMINYGPASED